MLKFNTYFKWFCLSFSHLPDGWAKAIASLTWGISGRRDVDYTGKDEQRLCHHTKIFSHLWVKVVVTERFNFDLTFNFQPLSGYFPRRYPLWLGQWTFWSRLFFVAALPLLCERSSCFMLSYGWSFIPLRKHTCTKTLSLITMLYMYVSMWCIFYSFTDYWIEDWEIDLLWHKNYWPLLSLGERKMPFAFGEGVPGLTWRTLVSIPHVFPNRDDSMVGVVYLDDNLECVGLEENNIHLIVINCRTFPYFIVR